MSEKIPEIIASEKFRNKFGKYLSIDEKVQNENGCYIATCVYGSYDCPQVLTLRRFRDYESDTECEYLLNQTFKTYTLENIYLT